MINQLISKNKLHLFSEQSFTSKEMKQLYYSCMKNNIEIKNSEIQELQVIPKSKIDYIIKFLETKIPDEDVLMIIDDLGIILGTYIN